MIVLRAVALATALSCVCLAADVEWPSYNADLKGTRYRPLDQINAANFSRLEVAWRIKTDSFGNRPEYKLEGTPLMVKGVVYATAGSRRAAIALDAATGELLWVHGEREGERGAAAPRQLWQPRIVMRANRRLGFLASYVAVFHLPIVYRVSLFPPP